MRPGSKPPPPDFSLIEETVQEYASMMRQHEIESHEGKRIVEASWPIFRIHHARSRYIYEMFYKKQAISRELYDWCLKEGVADKELVAKWKRQGYENLCCLRCIQPKDTNFGQCVFAGCQRKIWPRGTARRMPALWVQRMWRLAEGQKLV